MGNVALKDRDNKRLLTESLVVTKDINVRDVYDVVEVIGKGSISTIYKIRRKVEIKDPIHHEDPDAQVSSLQSDCVHPTANSDEYSSQHVFYALKEIDLTRVDPPHVMELRNEIEVLRRMDHPNIIRAYETYNYTSSDSTSLIGLVLELCTGGDLYSRAPYTEQQAGALLYKLAEALNYMHHQNFIHRDIKLENLMFESNDQDSDIKLVDFGLSTKFLKNECFDEFVGTVYTMAPQVFMGHYTQAADMWSVGVVAFLLLSDNEPFKGKSNSETAKLIFKGKHGFDHPAWKCISEGAKSFVSKLMQYEPSTRYTAEQALKDEWLAQFKPNVSQTLVKDVLSRLQQVSDMSEFEKLAWLVAARMANPTEISQWRIVFDELDMNHDGHISYKELKSAMVQIVGYKSHEIAEIFRHVDVQSAGAIEYTTFLAVLLAVQGRLQEERLEEVFDHLDVDHCGYITRDHIRQILGNEVSDEYIGKVMQGVVAGGDGKIGYEAFKKALNNKQGR